MKKPTTAKTANNISEVERLKAENREIKSRAVSIIERLFELIEEQKAAIHDITEANNNLVQAKDRVIQATKDLTNLKLQQQALETERELGKIYKLAENHFAQIKRSRAKGARELNKTKKTEVQNRRDRIENHLIDNPDPDLKGRSLEGYLIEIKNLNLIDTKGKELSQRTIANDLKDISKKTQNSSLKTFLEKR